VALRPVGGWRSGPAGLEVGGKGKIIANCGLRIADCGFKSKETGVRRSSKLKGEIVEAVEIVKIVEDVEGNASVWNSGILECWVDEAESQLDFVLFLLGERMLSSGKYDL
jgi:hypothetical protein